MTWTPEREAEVRKQLEFDEGGFTDDLAHTDLPDALAEISRLRKRVREVEAETWEKAAKLVPVAYDWLAHDFENKAQAARREP